MELFEDHLGPMVSKMSDKELDEELAGLDETWGVWCKANGTWCHVRFEAWRGDESDARGMARDLGEGYEAQEVKT